MPSGNPITRELVETTQEWLDWARFVDLTKYEEKVDTKCTCGVESIGGGAHSGWCDAIVAKENEND